MFMGYYQHLIIYKNTPFWAKYQTHGMLNDTSRGLWGLQNRRTFAPEKVKNEE
jgi:hypothetical protein